MELLQTLHTTTPTERRKNKINKTHLHESFYFKQFNKKT
jgi:hypothetical protein